MPMLWCDVQCMYDMTRRSFINNQWPGTELADTLALEVKLGEPMHTSDMRHNSNADGAIEACVDLYSICSLHRSG